MRRFRVLVLAVALTLNPACSDSTETGEGEGAAEPRGEMSDLGPDERPQHDAEASPRGTDAAGEDDAAHDAMGPAPEVMDEDALVGAPAEDAQGGNDALSEGGDVSPDASQPEVTPTEDVSVAEEVSVSLDAAEGEDVSALPDVPMEDVSAPGPDEDAQWGNDALSDVASGEEGDAAGDASCEPEGTWVLETTTAALAGEGCQPDGSPAQGPNTKTFIVTENADGSLSGVVPEVTEPIPEVTVTQLPDAPCSFLFTLSASIYFPSLGGEEPSTVYLTYDYTVDLADGGVHGSGTVHTATIFESGEVQQECTEAITVGGSFTPLGG